MMSAPPALPYRAPTYAPQQRPTIPAASAQPKLLIRAQAPEEPIPARPPLLTLPSPEKLGVAVRPVENAIDWTTIHAQIKEVGVVSFHMDSLPDGRSRFTCWVPSDRPGLTRRIECVAATEAEAVQVGLQQAARSRGDRP
ncbi:MAG: hypothetical protein ACRELF_04340 [Gemmataceae bacterium]